MSSESGGLRADEDDTIEEDVVDDDDDVVNEDFGSYYCIDFDHDEYT